MSANNRTHDPLRGDRRTKQTVVGTLCLIAAACTGTMCALALRDAPGAVEALDRITTFVLGCLTGLLGKMGVDNLMASNQRRATDAPEPEASA